MTKSVFGEPYANAYDLLYEEKDYASECDVIERALGRFAKKPARQIADLGCGTGNHSVILAQRGYRVIGIDRSDAMLVRAREKALGRQMSGTVEFTLGQLTNFRVDNEFDAVIVMFNVFGYLTNDFDVRTSLENIRRHLKGDGILLCEFWFGPAVLNSPAGQRHKLLKQGNEQIIRLTNSRMSIENNVCNIEFDLWRIVDNKVVSRVQETHSSRYFFREELEEFLNDTGFELKRLGAFPNFDSDPADDWSAIFIATVL